MLAPSRLAHSGTDRQAQQPAPSLDELSRRLYQLSDGQRGALAPGNQKPLAQQYAEHEAQVRARLGIAPDDPDAEVKMLLQMALAEAEMESGLPPGSLGEAARDPSPAALPHEPAAEGAAGTDPLLTGGGRTAIDDLRALEQDLAAAAAAGGDADEIQRLLAEVSGPRVRLPRFRARLRRAVFHTSSRPSRCKPLCKNRGQRSRRLGSRVPRMMLMPTAAHHRTTSTTGRDQLAKKSGT